VGRPRAGPGRTLAGIRRDADHDRRHSAPGVDRYLGEQDIAAALQQEVKSINIDAQVQVMDGRHVDRVGAA
jgi:hypothetical protein